MDTLQSPARPKPLPGWPKLRDSCNRCAASKLKCSKEKPTCARCAKRGMVCEYFMTKRAGRKKFSGSQPQNQAPPSPMIQHLPATAPSWTTLPISTAQITQLSPGTPSMGYQNMFSGTSCVADPTVLTPTTLDSNMSSNEFLASPISLSMLDMPDTGDFTDFCQFNDQNNMGDLIDIGRTATSHAANNASLPMKATAVPEVQLSFPSMQELPDDQSSLVDGLNSSLMHNFVGAFGLLKQLPSPSPPSFHTSNGQSLGNHPELDRLNTVQSIITGNEQAIQAISEMLECKSSEDNYLLAILSIVTLKVLASYATVVRQMPVFDGTDECWDTSDHEKLQHLEEAVQGFPTALIDNHFTDNEDQCRMTIQQILSQLHRVQRLVNALSQRFKTDGERAEAPDTSSSSSASSSSSSTTDATDVPNLFKCIETMFPFPSPVLKQLEVDLRERLRKLSAEIVDVLR
ncbi:hypothetical protein BGW36DRAFT_425831 [Talaromyces proteolyticus]|uniref:Zn(2)-C6 fungal-type domain-containing protein n=1 Tax=Talaromyces proteolyticus TaxID=1131652 RepID=A0AAD4KZM3_9EURO|nr:uncharacterized protein BGW36DRAFT_425831 [Talaromyces proteolyticus]KAH8701036.1 hypothetical protein BGW36DRAFT_425831 [Talaromyces proteolyticus]